MATRHLHNNAIVTNEDGTVSVYLSQFGDRGHVEAFLVFLRLQGAGSIDTNAETLVEVANDYATRFYGYKDFVTIAKEATPANDGTVDGKTVDNGVYVVDDDWMIVDRQMGEQVEDASEFCLALLQEINDSVRGDLVVDESALCVAAAFEA